MRRASPTSSPCTPPFHRPLGPLHRHRRSSWSATPWAGWSPRWRPCLLPLARSRSLSPWQGLTPGRPRARDDMAGCVRMGTGIAASPLDRPFRWSLEGTARECSRLLPRPAYPLIPPSTLSRARLCRYCAAVGRTPAPPPNSNCVRRMQLAPHRLAQHGLRLPDARYGLDRWRARRR